jgi:hypothetical protein
VSAESEVRAALVAHAALIAVVPAARISADAVEQGLARPYIASTIDIQCIGSDRAEAIEVRDLVRDALSAAGLPSDRGSAGFDPDQGLEVEVVTVDWFDV